MNYTVNHTPIKLSGDQAAEHNRRLVKQIAPMCKSLDDIEKMAIELAGHLSQAQFSRFEDMAIDAWYAFNVRAICDEVEASL